MKIQIFSDLHYEFSDLKLKIAKETDVVVLAGDIVNGDQLIHTDRLEKIIKLIKKPIIYVAGNHEFYNQENVTVEEIREVLEGYKSDYEHFHYLENDSVIIDGVRFLGATLWSNFNTVQPPDAAMLHVERAIRDFRHVYTTDEQNLTVADIVQWNEKTRGVFKKALLKRMPTVVVTHFCPHPRSTHPKYQDNIYNSYFVCDCSTLMDGVSLWIHGHTHSSMDYMLGDTRVVCNPRGYHSENEEYQGKFLVEVTP